MACDAQRKIDTFDPIFRVCDELLFPCIRESAYQSPSQKSGQAATFRPIKLQIEGGLNAPLAWAGRGREGLGFGITLPFSPKSTPAMAVENPSILTLPKSLPS